MTATPPKDDLYARVLKVAHGDTINGTYKMLPFPALDAFREDLKLICDRILSDHSDQERTIARLREENARLRVGVAKMANTINVEGSPFHRAQQALDDIVSAIKTDARATLNGEDTK